MRVHPFSDLHIEDGHDVHSFPDCDVLVAAGDIGSGVKGLQRLIKRTDGSQHIVMVAGNHEYYGHHMRKLQSEMRALASKHDRVHFLENDEAVIGGVRFLGCTMWTDYEAFGASGKVFAELDALKRMNDFKHIKAGDSFVTPSLFQGICAGSRAWLEGKLSEDWGGATVIVTHHPPVIGCNAKRYLMPGNVGLPFFVNEWPDLVASSGARYWICGHTHWCGRLPFGDTEVVCNQRGYSGEGVEGWDSKMILNI